MIFKGDALGKNITFGVLMISKFIPKTTFLIVSNRLPDIVGLVQRRRFLSEHHLAILYPVQASPGFPQALPLVSWKATFLLKASPLNFLNFRCLKGDPFMYKYLYLPKVFWNLQLCFQETWWNPSTLPQKGNSWASNRCRWPWTTELKPSQLLWPLRNPQKPWVCHFRRQGGASVQAPLARPQNLRSKLSWHESSSRPDMEGHRRGSWEPGWGLGSPRLWHIHLTGPSQEPPEIIFWLFFGDANMGQ